MSCESNSRKAAVCAAKAGVSSLASKGAYAAGSVKQVMRNNKGAVAGAMVGGSVAGAPGAAVGAAIGKGHQYTLGKVGSTLKRKGMTPTALRSSASSKVQSARAEYRQKANAATAPYVAQVRATEATARDWVKKNGDRVAGAVDQTKASAKARSDQAGAAIKQGAATVAATPVGRAAGAAGGYAKGVGRSSVNLMRAERKLLRSNRAERKNIKAARKSYKAQRKAYRNKFNLGRVLASSGVSGAVAGYTSAKIIKATKISPTAIVTGVVAGQVAETAMGNMAWRRSAEGKEALTTLKTAKSEAKRRYQAAHNTYMQSLKGVGRSLLGRGAK